MQNPWKWMDGKKTILAALWWGVVPQAVHVWWPAGVPYPVGEIVETIGLVLIVLGLGHKAVKGRGAGA